MRRPVFLLGGRRRGICWLIRLLLLKFVRYHYSFKLLCFELVDADTREVLRVSSVYLWLDFELMDEDLFLGLEQLSNHLSIGFTDQVG